MSDAGIRVEAHAKVNLTLEILGKRHDGYHNLVSVMQTLELHDTITVLPSPTLSITCSEPSLSNEDNLAFKAAAALRAVTGATRGAQIGVEKAIPVAAGLGGGSSDAAAVLRGLNELWNVGLTAGELASLAFTLGADVPFFLRGGTALVQGRGDDVTPLPPAQLDWIVVLSPESFADDKTRRLFAQVQPRHYTRGALSHKLAGRIRAHGDVPPQFFFNAFSEIAVDAFPQAQRAFNDFGEVGARDVVLSGAGPSFFAVPPNRETGVAWQLLLQSRGWRAFLTRAWWSPDRQVAPE